MAIRLTKNEIQTIESNGELVSQVAMADLIAVESEHDSYRDVVYKRPIAEVEARGLPAQVQAVTFQVAYKRDAISLAQKIRKIKDLP